MDPKKIRKKSKNTVRTIRSTGVKNLEQKYSK